MSPNPEYNRELGPLLSAMIDGTLSRSEEVRLGELLRDHPEAQQVYLDFCLTHALLRQELGAFPGGSEGKMEPEGKRGPAPLVRSTLRAVPANGAGPLFPNTLRAVPPNGACPLLLGSVALSYTLAALMIAAGVIATLAWNVPRGRGAAREIGRSAAPESHVKGAKVGKVGRLIACRWENNGAPVKDAADVMLGQKFALRSGHLEIVYSTGLTVSLEGPATFAADSLLGGYLSQGSLQIRTNIKSETAAVRAAAAKAGTSPAGAEPERLSRWLTIIRTPAALASEVDADFRVEVDRSGASVVRVSRGTVQLQLAGDGPERGVVLHGNWQARVETVGIFRGITVAGGPSSTALATTYTSHEGLARLIAGNKAAAAAGDSGWQFVRLDPGAPIDDARSVGAGRDHRPPQGSGVAIRWKSKSTLSYRTEFEPCRDRPAAIRQRIVASYAARNRLIAVRLNGKELPGPWRASDRAVQQFGALTIDDGFRDGVNVLEFDVSTDVLDPVKDPPLRMSGAFYGFRQVHPTAGAPANGHSSELRL